MRFMPRASFFVLVFAFACGSSRTLDPDGSIPSSDAGAPLDLSCESHSITYEPPLLPPVLADGFFAIQPFECRDSTRTEITGWRLSIGADGSAYLGVPDGPSASGTLRCESNTWVFRSREVEGTPPLAFVIGASPDSRAALTLASVEPERPWRAWAVRVEAEPREPGIVLPELAAACATRERWRLETRDGITLAEGDRTPTVTHLPQLKLGLWSTTDTVSLWDPSLERSVLGWAVAWNGEEGIARTTAEATVCSAWDDAFTFARRGDAWTADVRWRVPDVEDLDRDGDHEDELVRVSRYELTRDACR